jgi:hypothetical protein
VDVGGPFKIETKPYNIAAKVELAKADDKPDTSTPATKPETPTAEPAPVTTQVQESPTKVKKGANWIILSALIGLGVAAAGFAVYKKMV